MMRTQILATLCLTLAACGTPQDKCIARNTRDLRVVDGLIAQVQGNLTRGYALREVTENRAVWTDCQRRRTNKNGKVVLVASQCFEDEPVTETRPEAIDPVAEQRKLAGLQDRRRALALQATPAIAACRAQYPA